MITVRNFCKTTQLHGFYELSNSRSKAGKVIWFIAIAISLTATTYLVANAIKEFFDEPVRVILKRAEPGMVSYPSMKICFLHWISWVNWSRVEEHNFTKAEFLYAMSYLTEVNSTEVFDVELVETSVKKKLESKNMTLKEFFVDTAQKKKVFYDFENYNYKIELIAINNPKMENIFDVRHTICYVFSQNEITNLINEADLQGLSQSLEKGYEIKIDMNSLTKYEYQYEKYNITKNETERIYKYSCAVWGCSTFWDYIPVRLYPDKNNPSYVELRYEYSVTEIQITMAIYSKKNSPGSVEICDEGKKSLNVNFTFVEDSFEETRTLIAQKTVADDNWIGYLNDVSIKKIYFLNINGSVIENLTYIRRHKLEAWLKSPEKIKLAYDHMTRLKLFVNKNLGCEIWDINYIWSITDDDLTRFIFIIYPHVRQIVVREEIVLFTLSNFIGNIGGVLGIWTGASIISLLQMFHLLFGCFRGKKKRLGTEEAEPNAQSSYAGAPKSRRKRVRVQPLAQPSILNTSSEELGRRDIRSQSLHRPITEIELSDQRVPHGAHVQATRPAGVVIPRLPWKP